MNEIPPITEKNLRLAFAQDASDNVAARHRRRRLMRRIRRELAARDLMNLLLVRIWTSLVQISARTFVKTPRRQFAR